MRRLFNLRIEKRRQVSRLGQVVALFIAFVAALLVSAILVQVAKADPIEAFSALLTGALGSRRALLETLVKATPLILTGLAGTVAFRGKVWNIGAEGQLFAGAMGSYLAFVLFGQLPPALLFLMVVLFGFLAGAVCGLIPGLLKAKLNVDEIIVTVMLNYIVGYLASLLLSGPWQEEGSYYVQTATLPEKAEFPLLVAKSRLHAGFAIALLLTVVVYLLLQKTPLGYEIRALGANPRASRFKGINIATAVIVIMLISGGIAGLAGTGEVFGIHHRLRLDISPGFGYTGIIVAMLGGLNPFGVVLASVFFGALVNGSVRMQIVTGVPVALVYAIQAIVLLFLVSAQVLANYRIRRVQDAA
jgi:simple sugar transport system permease protein